MDNLLNKLSSYNIFNYLFPGVVFVIVASSLTKYDLSQENIIIALFLYYFIGLIISRVGSVMIEPLLKKINFVKYSKYRDFIEAERKDNKITVLSEQNNMLRTLVSLFFCLSVIKSFEYLSTCYSLSVKWDLAITSVFLLLLFLLAYRKQTIYIQKRVEHILKEE